VPANSIVDTDESYIYIDFNFEVTAVGPWDIIVVAYHTDYSDVTEPRDT